MNDNPALYETVMLLPSVRVRNANQVRRQTIHKYIPLRFLLIMLKESRLILNKVTSWEDPFENFFLKEHFVKEGELTFNRYVSVENLTTSLYGMSWTLQDETDSLWRVYSPDQLSARITTKVESLVEAVCSEDNSWDVWIDKVRYKEKQQIDEWLDKSIIVTSQKKFISRASESFFIKRKAFSAEKEFRVIVNHYDKNRHQTSFVCFQIDPEAFITSIITDPRLSKYEYEAVKAALVDAGVEKGRISPSQLYTFNPRKVELQYDPFPDF